MSRQKTKTKRYSVGINDEQEAALRDLMAHDMIGDVSTYFGMMILEIRRTRQENIKRPPGRPRSKEDDADDEDDQVEKYAAPDYPRNKSRYSHAGLVAYYGYDKRRGSMPARSALQLHPEWIKEQPKS